MGMLRARRQFPILPTLTAPQLFGDLSKLEEMAANIAKEGQLHSLMAGNRRGSRAHLEDESIAQREPSSGRSNSCTPVSGFVEDGPGTHSVAWLLKRRQPR